MRVPLAWASLIHNRRRLVASLTGILGAALLMFVQIGFFNAMLDSQVALIRQLAADLVIANRLKATLIMNVPFPRRRVFQALAVDGVAGASPVSIELTASAWKNPLNGRTRNIRVLAFDPEHPFLATPEVERGRAALRRTDSALFDTASRREFGAIRPGARVELAGRAVDVVGLFRLGTDLSTEGTVLMSEANFARVFPARASAAGELESAELGLIGLAPGADPRAVQRALRAALPGDVAVYTREEFAAREMAWWQDNAPIGFVFGLGAAMGFAIGVVICYQVLFTEVTDHLPQFATLKAIGYTNRYLLGVVVRQAVWLSALGFLPALAIAHVLYGWLAAATGLQLSLTPGRVALVLLLTVAMSVLAGLIAVRRALAADPAEVFG